MLGAVANATALGCANLAFSMLADQGAKECKKHNLALEQFQRTRDKSNEDRMKPHEFIKKRLREKNEAKAYINNVDEGILECYCVFGKK